MPGKRKRRRGKTALAALLAGLLLTLWAPAAFAWGRTTAGEPWGSLPAWAAEPVEQEGELRLFKYESCVNGGTEARAGIWLPHGYDPEERYDAVYFLPGTGGYYVDALTEERPCLLDNGEEAELSPLHLVERMAERGLIRPFILVCMEDMRRGDAETAARDLRNMMEYIADNYAVWAPEEGQSWTDVREHYSLLGFSQGAIYTQDVGMGVYFNRFANYGVFSYGSAWEYIAQQVNASPLELELMYVIAGNEDDYGADRALQSYRLLRERCPEKVRDGNNALLRRTELYGHGYVIVLPAFLDLLPRILPAAERSA